jgi:hypothetical protein
MKLRLDFITNSSSSSFFINLDRITEVQKLLIQNHIEVSEILKQKTYRGPYDAWEIKVEDDKIHGWTGMDNFDMYEFLQLIGIDKDHIHIDGSNY